MPGNVLRIQLTDEQQKQIKDATGKSIKELNIDLAAMGSLTEKELADMVGGAVRIWKDA